MSKYAQISIPYSIVLKQSLTGLLRIMRQCVRNVCVDDCATRGLVWEKEKIGVSAMEMHRRDSADGS